MLVICFAGPEGSAPYAMYLSWVVIAAGGYLSRWQTAAHGAVAVAGYWLALEIAGPSGVPMGLQLAMAAGTAAVAAFVMAGLAAHMRGVVSRLEDDARTDPLTGLDNRRALRAEFARELARAERTGRPLTLMVLDLDHFKDYNDSLGHPAGDRALQRVATILEDNTRSVEVAARIGGEEFAILAPDTDESGGMALAERLRVGVESAFAASMPKLTVSCGVAVHRPGDAEEEDLVAGADQALYAAKDAGRNRVMMATEPRHRRFKRPSEESGQPPDSRSLASLTK
jgi:diguanylate cyclase (GGDEF)-like protein